MNSTKVSSLVTVVIVVAAIAANAWPRQYVAHVLFAATEPGTRWGLPFTFLNRVQSEGQSFYAQAVIGNLLVLGLLLMGANVLFDRNKK